MAAVLANLSAAMEGREGASPLMAGTGNDKTHLLVICTADRGLCGGFNSSIAKMARARANELIAQGKEIKMLCVGKKGHDALKREFGSKIIDVVNLKEVKKIGFTEAQSIAATVLDLFEDDGFDICTLFYSEFQNVITQIPQAQQLIPATVEKSDDGDDNVETLDLNGAIYEYEPEEDEILADLLPRNVAIQILRALMENGASEQGARMSAMDNATRNAGEMIDNLTLDFNRRRQAQITSELIEIISGAEALNG
jgi:F-type H+-transporting ATPase subunit gamma